MSTPAPAAEAATTSSAVPAVSVRNLWKVFGPKADSIPGSPDAALSAAELKEKTGCVAAVNDVSFDVAPGEVFVVMGLSGSGKSTLVRCVTRLIEPTSGDVLVEGDNLSAADEKKLRELRRRRFAMVFQHFGLLPHRRVIDNVAYGLEVRGDDKSSRTARAQEVINLVGLSGFEQSFPDQLSGGMQQRVGLARALAGDPDIMFFDEPFSALDPLIRRGMQDEVLRLHNEVGKTMVFITHDLSEALRLGDRIMIMRHGRMVQVGRPDELVGAPADDYVRDFTRDIPRSHVLTMKWIARPLHEGEGTDGPELSSDMVIRDSIPAISGASAPARVVRDGQLLGVVSRDDLLTVIAGQEA